MFVSHQIGYTSEYNFQDLEQNLYPLITESTRLLDSSTADPEQLAALLGEIDSIKSQISDLNKETSDLLSEFKALSKELSALRVADTIDQQENTNAKEIARLASVISDKATPPNDKKNKNQQIIIELEIDLRKLIVKFQGAEASKQLNSHQSHPPLDKTDRSLSGIDSASSAAPLSIGAQQKIV